MVTIGSNAPRQIEDIMLTRYACYLIAQNNESIRGLLVERGIKPEELARAEDLKKLERRVKSDEKKLIKESALPKDKK